MSLREEIYADDEDREKWLEILGNVCSRFNWRCHAYCQMDNHYHIIIETAEANLSKGMRQLNGVYTQYTTYNSVNEVTTETKPKEGAVVDVTQYDYDLERNLKRITFPSGKTIDNIYVNGLLDRTTPP